MADKFIFTLIFIFLLAVTGSIALLASQPNDLECQEMIWATSNQELLLIDCINPNAVSGPITIKVTFLAKEK